MSRPCSTCLRRHRVALLTLRQWTPDEVLAVADTPAYRAAWAALDEASAALRRCATEGHRTLRRAPPPA